LFTSLIVDYDLFLVELRYKLCVHLLDRLSDVTIRYVIL